MKHWADSDRHQQSTVARSKCNAYLCQPGAILPKYVVNDQHAMLLGQFRVLATYTWLHAPHKLNCLGVQSQLAPAKNSNAQSVSLIVFVEPPHTFRSFAAEDRRGRTTATSTAFPSHICQKGKSAAARHARHPSRIVGQTESCFSPLSSLLQFVCKVGQALWLLAGNNYTEVICILVQVCLTAWVQTMSSCK